MRLTLRRPALPPLPLTLLTSAVLVVLPAVLLIALPRRSASGLERLLPSAALLQSFPAQPAQPPPPLWRQRLGPAAAATLWRSQRHLWWQFWGAHGDAGAFLALRAPAHLPLPANSLRVDDLLVVAPDPLARQLLQQQLQVRRRPPRGLALRCIQQLRQGLAVHWSAGAIAQMFGPLAPLAQELEQGCLQLASQGTALRWQGEADASEGSLAAEPPALSPLAPYPLPEGQWLELRGRQLDLLLRGLLTSPVVRQSLAQTYGLGPGPLRLLQGMPFQLRLQPVARGPFRAALQLQLEVGGSRTVLDAWLADLSAALRDQGLRESHPAVGLSAWSREDGVLAGGWRWLPGRQQLLLFLGPVPTALPASPPLEQASWRLRLRPQAMATAGMLPPGLPPVLRRSSQLELQGRPQGSRSGERQSALVGQLDLR
ncbi:MAG: hypothetical protein ACO3FA_04865 [Vulcanococcus sp.]